MEKSPGRFSTTDNSMARLMREKMQLSVQEENENASTELAIGKARI